MRDCAKHFLIVLPIAPISSRPEPTPIASDARLSGKGKNSTDEPVQMTETGKPGKQESCFPPFPLSLGIPQSGIPTFTQLRPFPSRSQPNAETPGPTFAGKVGPDLVDIRTAAPTHRRRSRSVAAGLTFRGVPCFGSHPAVVPAGRGVRPHSWCLSSRVTA